MRQALHQAIDIEAIKAKVMRGLSVPAGIITSPGVHGYTKELDSRLPHDPAAARKLLAEAGYPGGFDVRLDCPNDRYNNDEAICRAVVGMLARIGVTLSFLVVGVPPTTPSLGTLIRIGNNFLFSGEWWITFFPAAALVVLALSVNLLGDWLRDALNPKLR